MVMSLLSRRKLISDWSLKEGEIWVIGGFLRSNKKLRRLNFATIADASSKIQIILDQKLPFKKESVILVEGKLVKRKNPNHSIELGEWELEVINYEILSESRKTLPFELIEKADLSLEPTRLKYRYLDLRRNSCSNLIKKSQMMNHMRSYLVSQNFIEVNTPALSVSSKEGANTFDTYIDQNGKKAKFSLSQSPQLYKQLLMISGLEKYFQFANCFRLEDLRSDRQYEFLQLDIEVAYSNQKQFFSMIEETIKYTLKNTFGINLNQPFRQIKYKECLEKYGSDKPDLRYELEIEKLNLEKLQKHHNHNEAYGIYLNNCSIYVTEEKWLKSLQTQNFIYLTHVINGTITKIHHMDKDMTEYKGQELKVGDTISNKYKGEGVWIFTTTSPQTKKNALISLGNLRPHFSRIPKGDIGKKLEFLWVTDWPLFEWNEIQNKWEIAHHLFTRPSSNKVGFNREKEKSLGYDLVLNGVELASGSQRNYIPEVQKYIFEIAGLSEQEIENNFEWFMEALNYGVPPHMGIAIGIDRMAQILLKTETIRDVIAFPKNNSGACPLTNSPTIVD